MPFWGGFNARHAAHHGPFRRWPIAALGALALLVVCGVAIRAIAQRACAAVTATAGSNGRAVYYDPGSGLGHCSYPDVSPGGVFASVPTGLYDGGLACGETIRIDGPRGSVDALVVDQCQACAGDLLDLSPSAFGRIASMSAGNVPVRYQVLVDPPLAGPLEFRVKPGSNSDWLGLQPLDHGNALTDVAVRSAGGSWTPLSAGADGYWTASGAGGGPYDVRVTESRGHSVTVAGVRLLPGAVQQSGQWMYGERTPAPTAPSPVTVMPSVNITVVPMPPPQHSC